MRLHVSCKYKVLSGTTYNHRVCVFGRMDACMMTLCHIQISKYDLNILKMSLAYYKLYSHIYVRYYMIIIIYLLKDEKRVLNGTFHDQNNSRTLLIYIYMFYSMYTWTGVFGDHCATFWATTLFNCWLLNWRTMPQAVPCFKIYLPRGDMVESLSQESFDDSAPMMAAIENALAFEDSCAFTLSQSMLNIASPNLGLANMFYFLWSSWCLFKIK